MKRRIPLALAVVLLLAANPLQDEAVQKELQQLEGTWLVTSLTIRGDEQPKVADFHLKLILKGGRFTVKSGDTVLGEGTFKIDPARKPKSMEQTSTTGGTKGQTTLGIYEIAGDTLKTCFATAGQANRPTEFASKAGTDHELAVYQREKP
jgi:uncharacterized protein (TIGR03067 family)